MVGRQFPEPLTGSGLNLMAAAGQVAEVRGDPGRIEAVLDSPELFRSLFSPQGRDPLLQGSPFLLFAVPVHRASRDPAQASSVEEWAAPRQPVPAFAVGKLREFGASPMRGAFFTVRRPSTAP